MTRWPWGGPNGNKRLSRKVVADVITAWGRLDGVRQDADGFHLPGGWLIRSGSGIAGRSGHFFLWNLRTGEQVPEKSIATVRELRAAIMDAFYPSISAASAAGRDPASEDADAAWRDGEAHGRDK